MLLFAETVETHQRSISIWSKAAAKVAVGQGKNGEADMKRIIFAALVGVLVSGPVSGPVWAAEYWNPWRNYDTHQERMSLAKKIRKDFQIDQMDRLVPYLSPSEIKWLDEEMNASSERLGNAIKSKEFAIKGSRRFVTVLKSLLDDFETVPPEKEFPIWVALAAALLDYGAFDMGLCVNVIKNCPDPYTKNKGSGFWHLEVLAVLNARVILMGVLGPKLGFRIKN